MNDRTPLPRPPHGIGDKTREVSALLRELGWWPLGEQHYFELERGLDCLAALLPPAPAIPEGWRLVPEVATYEMVTAGMRALREAPVKGVYASMLDAAPTPPVAADAPDHAAMHQQLLDMLGAKDHVDAARIIGQHHAREIAPQPAAAPQADANPYSPDFRDGFDLGRGESEFLCRMIRNPICDTCGATSAADAEQKCKPSGDDCPGQNWPLERLWELAAPQAAEPVEYQFRLPDVPWHPWQMLGTKALADELAKTPGYEVRALYTAPPPPASTDAVALVLEKWRQESERVGTCKWSDGFLAGVRRCLFEMQSAQEGRSDPATPLVAPAEVTADARPSNCRNRLRDEGKAHPRSGCQSCGDGGLRGCPFERKSASPAGGPSDG